MRLHPKSRASTDHRPGPNIARAAAMVPVNRPTTGCSSILRICEISNAATTAPATGVHRPTTRRSPARASEAELSATRNDGSPHSRRMPFAPHPARSWRSGGKTTNTQAGCGAPRPTAARAGCPESCSASRAPVVSSSPTTTQRSRPSAAAMSSRSRRYGTGGCRSPTPRARAAGFRRLRSTRLTLDGCAARERPGRATTSARTP
jgi:hypothetical protein